MSTRLYISLYVSLISIVLFSCKQSDNVDDTATLLAELLGRELVVPENLNFYIQNNSIDKLNDKCDYKIIAFIDSSSCTKCSLKLQQWEDLINELSEPDKTEINLILIMNPSDISEAKYLVRGNRFPFPYTIDNNRVFITANNLPADNQFNVFLTDCDNNILAVGNPISNPNIKALFRNIVSEEDEYDNLQLQKVVPASCSQKSRNVGIADSSKPIEVKFAISNTRDQSISISDVITSCDCTSALPERTIIEPKSDCFITIKIIPDNNQAGYFSQYADVYFSGYSTPIRLGISGFLNKNQFHHNSNQLTQ